MRGAAAAALEIGGNMQRSLIRAGAVALAMTLVAVGCGSDDDGQRAAPNGDVEVPETGEGCTETVAGSQIDYGVFAPARAIDPPSNSGALVGGTELAAVYDVPFTFNFETNQFEPKLAESLEPNDDFTTWTLTLREGITFSDEPTPDVPAAPGGQEERGVEEVVLGGERAVLVDRHRVVEPGEEGLQRPLARLGVEPVDPVGLHLAHVEHLDAGARVGEQHRVPRPRADGALGPEVGLPQPAVVALVGEPVDVQRPPSLDRGSELDRQLGRRVHAAGELRRATVARHVDGVQRERGDRERREGVVRVEQQRPLGHHATRPHVRDVARAVARIGAHGPERGELPKPRGIPRRQRLRQVGALHLHPQGR